MLAPDAERASEDDVSAVLLGGGSDPCGRDGGLADLERETADDDEEDPALAGGRSGSMPSEGCEIDLRRSDRSVSSSACSSLALQDANVSPLQQCTLILQGGQHSR